MGVKTIKLPIAQGIKGETPNLFASNSKVKYWNSKLQRRKDNKLAADKLSSWKTLKTYRL